MKIFLILIFVAILVSGCVIGDGERDYAMSHPTSTASQSSLTTSISAPSTNIPLSDYWIKIDPIGDKRVGDKFKITAKTNLSAGKEIYVETYSEFFNPTSLGGIDAHTLSYARGFVKVNPANTGANTISFDLDTSDFEPANYTISMAEFERNRTPYPEGMRITASYVVMPKEKL
jgi:hypothetical protein